MATPAHSLIKGTPASKRANVPPQTVAIEDEPLLSSTSEVKRIVNGKFSGMFAFNAFSANEPCPISLLPMGPNLPISFVAKGGNS